MQSASTGVRNLDRALRLSLPAVARLLRVSGVNALLAPAVVLRLALLGLGGINTVCMCPPRTYPVIGAGLPAHPAPFWRRTTDLAKRDTLPMKTKNWLSMLTKTTPRVSESAQQAIWIRMAPRGSLLARQEMAPLRRDRCGVISKSPCVRECNEDCVLFPTPLLLHHSEVRLLIERISTRVSCPVQIDHPQVVKRYL